MTSEMKSSICQAEAALSPSTKLYQLHTQLQLECSRCRGLGSTSSYTQGQSFKAPGLKCRRNSGEGPVKRNRSDLYQKMRIVTIIVALCALTHMSSRVGAQSVGLRGEEKESEEEKPVKVSATEGE